MPVSSTQLYEWNNANQSTFPPPLLLSPNLSRRAILRASSLDSIRQILEGGNGALPVDAGIGNRNALLERGWSLGWHLLVALVDVGLDHDADDGLFACAQLLADDLGDAGLVAVVFVGVA